jgi:exonuclease III
MDLRILTYNIRGLPWSPNTLKPLVNWILTCSNCEIACLQEVFLQWHRDLIAHEATKHGWQIVFPEDSCTLFASGSGLAFLAKPTLLLTQSHFTPFKASKGVDSYITKGVHKVTVEKGDMRIQLLNTHLQSDITNLSCCRINYRGIRELQEKELYDVAQRYRVPFVVGDLNKEYFNYFERIDLEYHSTFPETGEHLDHLLFLERCRKYIIQKTITYFELPFSDHLPVLFKLRLEQQL